MTYVFEDNGSDPISMLYKRAYTNTDTFLYCQGADSILFRIIEEIEAKHEEIFIFMDMIYDNLATSNCYNRTVKKLRSAGYTNFIIFPLVCAEHYMIKSLYQLGLISKCSEVTAVISIDWHKGVSRNTYINQSRNFEQFCKRVLYKLAMNCANNTRFNDNVHYRDYYDQDCKCKQARDDCDHLSLEDKAISLLKQYPCIPSNSIIFTDSHMTHVDLVAMHRKLVDEYNKTVNRMRELETDEALRKNYSNIGYMI